jgi:Fe-S cluster biogenesis protein NfuA
MRGLPPGKGKGVTHTREFHVRSERIEQLAAKLEQAADPELHATAMELLQCVMELHGTGLDRIMQVLSESDEAGSLAGKLLDDNLVSSLLLLHNLHPDDLATRVGTALEKVRPHLESNSCAAELVGIENGVVSLRLLHQGGGCHSTANTMAAALEDAITEAAPDAERITVETLETPVQAQLVTIAQITSEGVSHAAHQAG